MSRRKKASRPNKGKGPKHEPSRDLSSLVSYAGQPGFYTQTAWRDNRIEQINTFKHWVYIAIDSIATRIAMQIPNVSYITKSSNSLMERKFRQKALTPLPSHQSLKPVEDNHPLLRLLKDPNDPDTAFDAFYETIMFLLLTGSAYWWIPRNKVGLPVAIWVVPSHWVWPVMGKERLIDAYELRPVEGNYLRKIIPAHEIIHFRKKSPISKIDGFSPMTAGNQWIDIQDSVNRSKWQTYKNGTFPTVSVQFDGSINDPTDEQLRRIEAKFMQRYVGELNTNKPLFLPPGVKVSPLVIQPNQMVFGETAKETRDNILALFRVPHSTAGVLDGMTLASATAGNVNFCQNAINPLCYQLAQTLTEKLGWLYDQNLKIWWEDFTPDDPAQLERELKTDAIFGARTTNDVRVLRGLEPYPYAWADMPVMPTNMNFVDPEGNPFGGAHTDPKDQLGSNMPDQPNMQED